MHGCTRAGRTHRHTPEGYRDNSLTDLLQFYLFALLLFLRSQSPFQCNYVIRDKDYKQIEICPLPVSSEVEPFKTKLLEAYSSRHMVADRT